MTRNLQDLGINLQKIVTRLQNNQNLLKLLYYTDKDPLAGNDLTSTQIKNEIFEKLVKIVPLVSETETANSLVAIRVINGSLHENDQFQDIYLGIEIFVPMTQWIIKNSNLRPFAIMSEISKSLNGKVIDGLGQIQNGSFELSFLTEEMSCYNMTFRIVV